jgi:hypothetical protein
MPPVLRIGVYRLFVYLENNCIRGSSPQLKVDSIAQTFQAPRQPVHQLMTPLLVNIVAPALHLPDAPGWCLWGFRGPEVGEAAGHLGTAGLNLSI